MIKIAMLGCDSSHTEIYTSLINNSEQIFKNEAKVVMLWDEDYLMAQQKADLLGIQMVLKEISSDALAGVDFIMVTGRYARSHFKAAEKAILAGKPTYIDKPFTDDIETAEKIIFLSQKQNVPIMSFSSLKFSREVKNAKSFFLSRADNFLVIITCPFNTSSISNLINPGFNFYSIHAVDMLTEIINSEILTVSAKQNLDGIFVNIEFADKKIALINLPFDADELFLIDIYGKKEVAHFSVDLNGDFYQETLKILVEELACNKITSAPISGAYKSIRILDMIKLSLKNNKMIFADEKI